MTDKSTLFYKKICIITKKAVPLHRISTTKKEDLNEKEDLGMKKFVYPAVFCFVVSMLTVACAPKHPTPNAQEFTIPVGGSEVLEVYHASYVSYSYSKSRDAKCPVFEISDFQGKSTTIHALHAGKDTLWVESTMSYPNIYDGLYKFPVAITVY